MINRIRKAACFLPVVCAMFFCRCVSDNMAGGGTEDVNTRVVIGRVLNPDGSAAPGAEVQLIPESHDPVRISRTIFPKDTTDDAGTYWIFLEDTGKFNAQIVQVENGTRAMISSEEITGDTTVYPAAVLSEPGNIKVALPENTASGNGYVYIPGTLVYSYINDNSGNIMLDSVPADMTADIVYATVGDSTAAVLRFDVPVNSRKTTVVSNPGWTHCRTLVLNTSVTGANVSGDVYEFPVLVRLNNRNFNFSQAEYDGADIRFITAAGTSLAYEIERWNRDSGRAEIWVNVDTVYGNDSLQTITMYWGNPAAANKSNSAMVFDTAAGFQGVWHMGQPGNSTANDATANSFDGTPVGMNEQSLRAGMVGGAQQFSGNSSYILLEGTADSRLAFPQNGTFTLYAWVYTEIIDSLAQYIISKSTYSYSLLLSKTQRWELYNVKDEALQSVYAEPAMQQWNLLTGVCDGEQMRLYVDGVCIDSVQEVKPGLTRDSSYDVYIGKRADSDGYGCWNGILDEVRISDVALSADWIMLCYMNQREDDRLITFK